MENSGENTGNSFMLKICAFIVDKRNLFFLIYAILCIFAAISRGWVGVENQLSEYLPRTSETRLGLDLMEEQFTTYGSTKVMVANVSYDQALLIQKDIEDIDGVFSAELDDTDKHYNNGSALFNITFDYDEKDEKCLVLLDEVKKYFNKYDYYLSTTLGDTQSELIAKEMDVISVIVVFVVVGVLLLTSQAYAEVPILLLTFGSAALVQMGTNFLLGTISFVSNSVTIVLQLALSVDYAVIFLNRYKEEHAELHPREACIIALSKSIPEISGSSLTTIGGLIAMLFMQFGIGRDMGIVLIKAILLSLLSVFLLMPGIIMVFSGLMEKTKHKNFIPQIPFVGKFAYATRYIIAPAFVVVIIIANRISAGTPYVYGYTKITPPLINEVQAAQNMQDDNFRSDNMVALVFPSGDYDTEKRLIEDLLADDNVSSITGLANTEALNGYTLTEKLTPRQFSELLNIDYEIAELIYTAYAVNDEDYAKVVNGLANYKVPLIDMFMFVYREVEEGYVTLSDELMDKLENANRMMEFAKKQLQGEDYSRILVYLNLPQESDETFAFLKKMHTYAEKYYDEDKIYVVGESVSQYDLKKCFARDNMVTSVISILAVLVVLLFTFKSAGMPVLLIAVIQGCIWINFSVPAIQHDNLFFLGYLIVSSIQMGANIDYAIVIAGRYTELRQTMGKRDAIIDTMNLSFPTIITSGTMLAVAGTLIGKMTSDCAIYGIGKCLGRGTIISILITMFVLPQILLVGDKVIELTAFVMNVPLQTKQRTGTMRIDGAISGHIDGNITGVIHAVVKGNVSAFVENGDVTMMDEEPYDTGAKESEFYYSEGEEN
ncbi:Predicted exporter protein, RND superfamily [Butyrivibrio proteoclasticus]|uniref:Predicted exporter protein, RND superfamily n=1 Tax=Butyrivibrio proteoclasticus TaxID=43305 RepID=A0A1I5UEH7_9FIRM|nr:MMPL family transporter [Butyrivibrio proteoclasticus]SFP93629.1 Predicted exporter protein, RND superfamily [Butyrivibrio proteoclasticus]